MTDGSSDASPSSSSYRSSRYSSILSSAAGTPSTQLTETVHTTLQQEVMGIALDDLLGFGVSMSDIPNLAAALFDYLHAGNDALQTDILTFAAGEIRSSTPAVTSGGSQYSGANKYSIPSRYRYSRSVDDQSSLQFSRQNEDVQMGGDGNEGASFTRRLLAGNDIKIQEFQDWDLPMDEDFEAIASTVEGKQKKYLPDDARSRQALLARREFTQLKQWSELLKLGVGAPQSAIVFGRFVQQQSATIRHIGDFETGGLHCSLPNLRRS